MRAISTSASVILLLICLADAPAQTYTIKLKTYPEAGTTVTIRDTYKETGSTKFTDPDGKLLNEVKPKSREEVYTQTTLQRTKSDAAAEKFKRAYEKAVGTEDGKTFKRSYQGRTVVYERRQGKYWIGVVGKPPLEKKDLDHLFEELSGSGPSSAEGDKAITPDKPVAVGDRWPVNPKILGSIFKGSVLDAEATQGEASLIKVYTKGKSQFGVIEVNVKFTMKGFGPALRLDPPIILEAKATIDTAIDGSSVVRTETFTARVKGKSILVQEGLKKGTLEMDSSVSGRTEHSEEKDDPKELTVPAVEFIKPSGIWSEFTSKEGRFSASFPGEPQVKSTKDDQGNVTTQHMVTREQGMIAYSVAYTVYANANPKADPKTVLQAVANGLAKDTKEKKDIKLNGHLGLELLRELEQDGVKMIVNQRIYYLDGRLYQAIVASAVIAKDKAEVSKFLDSLKLHDKKDEKEPKKEEKR
jgi:hypothetical protein